LETYRFNGDRFQQSRYIGKFYDIEDFNTKLINKVMILIKK